MKNNKYRIVKIGYGYYVQKYTVHSFDGILDYMWKDCARFDDEESAKKYFDYLVKKTWHSRFNVLLYKQDKTTILKDLWRI